MIIEDSETKTLVASVKDIFSQDTQSQLTFLNEIGHSLQTWTEAEDFTILSQAELLYTVYKYWEPDRNPEGLSFLLEAKSLWDDDFYLWAKAFSKRRANREPADVTIRNKVSYFRDLIADKSIKYPESVFLPKRNEAGKIIASGCKEEDWVEVPFDKKKCDYGKMLVAKQNIRNGEMSPEAWQALLDPYATVNELKIHLQKQDTIKERSDFHFSENNGIIYVSDNGDSVAVFQILFGESEETELFYRGVVHLMQAIGLSVPLEYLEKIS